MADAESKYRPEWRRQTKTGLDQLGARPSTRRDTLLDMLGVHPDAVSDSERQMTLEVLNVSWEAIANLLTDGRCYTGKRDYSADCRSSLAGSYCSPAPYESHGGRNPKTYCR